jgi:acetyl-CoA acetyltransferase family protein
VRAVVVVDAVRTPVDGRGGRLSGWHPADLAGELLRALADRCALEPATVGDVILGCAMPVGSQGFNVARNAVLAAGWPLAVPGGTAERQAVSSIAAIAAAANAVASGACDVVVAGGVEVMSTTPQGATLVPGAMPFGPAVTERFREAGGLVPAGLAAERLASEAGLDRAALDAIAVQSHQRAVGAGVRPEVVPVAARVLDREKGEIVHPGTTVTTDQLPSAEVTLDELATYQPLFDPGGVVTAGNSAPAADGAAVLLLASEAAAERIGRDPLAELASVVLLGADPTTPHSGAGGAALQGLVRAGCRVEELDRVELAEPFAAVLPVWEAAIGIEPGAANPTGGGLAVGEPTGAVGALLVAALGHAIAGRSGATGLAVVAGNGLGGAVVLRS